MNTVYETRDKNPHFELLTGYLWKVKIGEKPSVEKEGQEMTQEVAEGSMDPEYKPRAVTRMAVNKELKLSG